MISLTASRRLTAALTRTLEVKAEQAVAHLADDEHDAPGITGVPGVPGGPPRRRSGRRRVLVPAAALIVALALLGAGVVVLRGGSSDEPATTVTLGDPPDGWLVPAWVPEGMEPWGIDWSSSPGPGGSGEPATIPQLFGDPDEGGAIYLTSFRYDLRPGTGEQITVRGQPGVAGTGWDVDETDVGDAITWDERGATITALYKGMTREEAIAALDSLEARSDDPADGFAPASDSSWPLRGEIRSGQPTGRDVTLEYSDGVPASGAGGPLGLRIHTSASSAVSADYLDAWYEQGSEAGGGERPLRSYDQDGHELMVVWPDGRSIIIAPTGAPPSGMSRATLERIADSLTVATEADLAGLRDAAEANIEALPVVASAGTTIGTVEVHGEGGFVRLCLRAPGEQRSRCGTSLSGGGSSADGTALATGEWTIDGTWYVVVASTGEEHQILGGRDPSSSPDAGELPSEDIAAGDWTVRLVQPAPDIQQVCTSDGLSMSCSHHRPG
jgi:hypothetical protein